MSAKCSANAIANASQPEKKFRLALIATELANSDRISSAIPLTGSVAQQRIQIWARLGVPENPVPLTSMPLLCPSSQPPLASPARPARICHYSPHSPLAGRITFDLASLQAPAADSRGRHVGSGISKNTFFSASSSLRVIKQIHSFMVWWSQAGRQRLQPL